MTLKSRITEDMKDAMRAKDAARLSTIRLLLAAIKQREVDERKDMTDADVLAIIEKMVKQRRDSISQFEAGNRPDLVAVEQAELLILQGYQPQQLSEGEIDALVAAAIASTGAAGPSGMGKVMAELKGKLAGRADMSAVSAQGQGPSRVAIRRSTRGNDATAFPDFHFATARRRHRAGAGRWPDNCSPFAGAIVAYNQVIPEQHVACLPVARPADRSCFPRKQPNHDPQRLHPDAFDPRRYRRGRGPVRPAEEGRRQLRRLLPVPQRKDAVVFGQPHQAVLSLLRLRRAWHRHRVPDGACRQDVSRCVEDLARDAGLEVPRNERAGDKERRAEGEDLNELLLSAARFYRGRLKDAPQAIEYLKGRGLTGEIAARFGIGLRARGLAEPRRGVSEV